MTNIERDTILANVDWQLANEVKKLTYAEAYGKDCTDKWLALGEIDAMLYAHQCCYNGVSTITDGSMEYDSWSEVVIPDANNDGEDDYVVVEIISQNEEAYIYEIINALESI